MNMRLLIFLIIFCFSCNDAAKIDEINVLKDEIIKLKKDRLKKEKDETALVHTVFFWFNDDVTDEQKKQFADIGLANLITCKSIYKGYFGLPAQRTREVVDNSYGYALNCFFRSTEDEEIYQNDPQHLKFIETYKHLWKRVQVYDNLINH